MSGSRGRTSERPIARASDSETPPAETRAFVFVAAQRVVFVFQRILFLSVEGEEKGAEGGVGFEVVGWSGGKLGTFEIPQCNVNTGEGAHKDWSATVEAHSP